MTGTRAGTLALFLTLSATAVQPRDAWSFPGLASDRVARQAGDPITILVIESASAVNSAGTRSRGDTAIRGRVAAGSFAEQGAIEIAGSTANSGSTERAGRMVGQLTATVAEVLPSGDLRIVGEQSLRINGETTRFRVRGRVRMADITPANTVISSRIADAEIDYNGEGFVTRSAQPGLVARIFQFLGLL